MKKKNIFIILVLFISIIFNINIVSAECKNCLVCSYGEGKYKMEFDFDNNNNTYTIQLYRDGKKIDDKKVQSYLVLNPFSICPSTVYINLVDTGRLYEISLIGDGKNGKYTLDNPESTGNSNPEPSTVSKVSCGNIGNIPEKIPQITSIAVSIVQIAVLMGMFDLLKGITAQKEDEMKKGQQMFIKRLVIGVIIFFVVVAVKFLISLIADSENDTNNIIECIDCFINVDNCRR